MRQSAQFLRDKLDYYIKCAEDAPHDPFMNNRDISEAYENLGLCLFYLGNFRNAVENFTLAYNLRKEYTRDRGNPKLCLLVSLR